MKEKRKDHGVAIKLFDQQYWSLFNKYIQPQWRISLALAGLLLTDIILRLINPQIVRGFIDIAQSDPEQEKLLHAALLFLGLAFCQQGVSVASNYVGEIVAWTATNRLRVDLARHCLGLDLSFHNNHTPGEMIERVDGDINNLAHFFSRFIIEILGNVLLILGILLLMWRENWLIGLGLTVFVVLAMWIMFQYRNVAVPHWSAERKASADFYGFLEERLTGAEDIRSNGAEAYVMQKFHLLIREMLRKSLKSALVFNVLININQFLFAVGTAAALAIGTYLFFNDQITIGTVFLVYQYTNMLTRPMENISHQMDQFQRAGAGIIRVQELLNIKSNIETGSEAPGTVTSLQEFAPKTWSRDSKSKALALQFDGVSFGYKDVAISGPEFSNHNGTIGEVGYVLRDISFELAPGRVLGLLGRTGSGKTSLTRLVFRFYDPDSGVVRIGDGGSDRTDIRTLPLRTLRQQVGMVTQNVQLFNASVRDNLTFFDDTVPNDMIEAIIDEIGLSPWFRSLPDGMDTILESGGGLSGGEAQLLALTRIFLTNPGLVILDEASSRLDPLTESLIEKAMDRLIENRTAIIIAHRLRTVHKVDEIMILENGRIEEYGNREFLAVESSSKFYKLLKTGLAEVMV